LTRSCLVIESAATYLPTLVFVYAGQSHSFCRICLLLQYCSAPRREIDTLRLILSRIFTTS